MHKININGEISSWGYGARWLTRELDDKSGAIEVLISSYGGDVFEGVDMFNILRTYSREKGKVTTIVNGKAMSIASLIFLAGDTKKAFENSTIMIHKAWTWMAGNSDDLLQEAKVLDSIDNVLISEYDKYMTEDKTAIKDILAKEGWFIGKEELEPTGFIDEFIIAGDEVSTLALSKKAFAKNMDDFSVKAKEENVRPNLEAVAKVIAQVNNKENNLGGNNADTIPSDNVKLVNSNKGENMEFTEENFNALQAQTKVLVANRDTMTTRYSTLETQVETLTATLDTTKEQFSAYKAESDSKLSEADTKLVNTVKSTEARVKEAFLTNVGSESTILAMISSETDEGASAIAIAAKDGSSTNQGDLDISAKKVIEDAESNFAMNVAKTHSIGGKK